MPDLIRNEQLKLVASMMNALAVAVITIGVFAPLAAVIYGMGNTPQNSYLFNGLPYICFGISIGLHSLGQMALSRLDTGDDDE